MKRNYLAIIALSVDSRNLTLWQPDGSTMVIPQGDARVPRIVAEAKEKNLTPGKIIEVDVTIEAQIRQEFLDAERDTGGFVKFFRITKKKLQEFFLGEEEEQVPYVSPVELGAKPTAFNAFIANAVGKTLAVQHASLKAPEPEMTVTHERFYGNYAVWITDVDPRNHRIEVIHVIREISGRTSEYVNNLLAQPTPFKVFDWLTETQAKEFVRRLNNTQGVISVYNKLEDGIPAKVAVKATEPTNKEKLEAASTKLKAMGAVATDAYEFHTDLNENEETIVAVVNDKVVPDVQNLHRHIRQSANLKDYKGFTKFLERLSTVIDKHRHSVEDLMKFMEKGDLPIADDGSIVIFKRLESKDNPEHLKDVMDDVFVDCHSKKIEQCVGMRVMVKENLVDQNRRKDCSHGLHVASLQYIRNFSGNVTIIGKVAPEDVFAVPEYDVTKMRVSAYHIITKLPDAIRDHVNNGNPISTIEGGTEILNMVLSGNHPEPSRQVLVGGHYGTNLTYSELTRNYLDDDEDSVIPDEPVIKKTALNMEESFTATNPKAEPVKATDVKPIKKTKMEILKDLWNQFLKAETSNEAITLADEIIAAKGKCKKSWASLGFSGDMVQKLIDARANKPKPEKAVKQDKTVAPKKTTVTRSRNADVIRSYLNDEGMSDYCKAHAIHDVKRAAKKSYAALGLTPEECSQIDKLKHHLK